MKAALGKFLFGSVKRQLVFAVAMIHAVMMSLFVWDLSERQHEFLIERQTEQAQDLVQTLSLSTVSGILAKDVSGVQELVNSQANYPELVFAMLLDANGQILAHNDRNRVGQYVSDLAPAIEATHGTDATVILARSQRLVDVVRPIHVNGRLIGWARVGLSQSKTAARLNAVTRDGFIYTAAAIIIGAFLALWLGKQLTARLYAIRDVTDAVRGGSSGQRVQIGGEDEVARLADDFNSMLNALSEREAERIQLQRTIFAEKELAEVTLASIGDAVITTDSQGVVTFINPAASRILGVEQSESIGQLVDEIFQTFDATTRLKAVSPVTQVLRDGSVTMLTEGTLLIARDGSEYRVEETAAPIFHSDGALLGCVLVFHNVTETLRLLDSVRWQAGHDALTSLPNRTLLFDRIDQAIVAAKRHGRILGVLFVDLDNFKVINDSLGHDAGDELLTEAGRRLQQCVREGDSVARLGGDEFVMLLTEVQGEADVDLVARRVIAAMEMPFKIAGTEGFVTASIGASMYPRDGDNHSALLQHADIAMYRAKEHGRNTYKHFSAEMKARSNARLSMETQLRKALQNHELSLHYQPQIDLATGMVVGAEALLRWQSPELGMVSPAQFIPLAEETGLIVPIGDWVIDQACADVRGWTRLPAGRDCLVAINLSARQFAEDDLLETVVAALERHRLNAKQIELEITESLVMQSPEKASQVLQEIRALGCHVALDDFGTGYSSLAYLRRFPLDRLKIDKSLIQDVAIVRAVIQMASSFGLKTVAEGVEDDPTQELLRYMGCDIVQGYCYSRPLPINAFVAFMEARNMPGSQRSTSIDPCPTPKFQDVNTNRLL